MSSYVSKQADLRRGVYALLGRMNKANVVKHFQIENIPRSTIYCIIKRFGSGVPCEDEPRKGRPCKLSEKQRRNSKDCAENRVDISQRKLATKFNVSRSCIRRNLKKLVWKYYKRKRAPKCNPQQLEQIPSKCRRLFRELTDCETFIIVDDEK